MDQFPHSMQYASWGKRKCGLELIVMLHPWALTVPGSLWYILIDSQSKVLQDRCRRGRARSRGRIPQSRPGPGAGSRRESWGGELSPHSDALAAKWLSPRMIHRGTPAMRIIKQRCLNLRYKHTLYIARKYSGLVVCFHNQQINMQILKYFAKVIWYPTAKF